MMKLLLLFILAIAFTNATHGGRKYSGRKLKSSFSDRIVGGAPVNIADYGWQISLQLKGDFQCGGSIISEDWILSAAHCVYGYTVDDDFSVRVGSNNSESGGAVYDTDKIIVHPKYNPKTFDNDVCVIHVKSPIQLNATIHAATLVAEGNETAAGTVCTVTGWGSPKAGWPSAKLLQGVNVPIVAWEQCEKTYNRYGFTHNMICAGYKEGGKDTCNGDSGGPLVREDDKTLIGIVSWGIPCARPNYNGVYADIAASSIREFIKTNTNI